MVYETKLNLSLKEVSPVYHRIVLKSGDDTNNCLEIQLESDGQAKLVRMMAS